MSNPLILEKVSPSEGGISSGRGVYRDACPRDRARKKMASTCKQKNSTRHSEEFRVQEWATGLGPAQNGAWSLCCTLHLPGTPLSHRSSSLRVRDIQGPFLRAGAMAGGWGNLRGQPWNRCNSWSNCAAVSGLAAWSQ